METNHYETLGVDINASSSEIRDAYRRLVRLHHPDANPSDRDASETVMKRVLSAYAALSDPSKRARYDSQLKLAQFEAAQNSSSAGVRVVHHSATFTNDPKSLVGKVRVALDDSSETFAAKLGVSETDLITFETRDAIPQAPLQLRTFAHWVEQAAQSLEQNGKVGDAIDLRLAFSRKKANRNFFR